MSSITSSTSTALKRKPTARDESTSPHSGIPPLPEIRGDILLQVLTHRSLRRLDQVTEDFDNERLAELGAKVLETVITATLFHRRPLLSGMEILERRENITSEENMDAWVDMYRLREKVRCSPEIISSLKSPEETRILFHAYVGGLYREGGLEPVQRWLDGLTNDDTAVTATTQASPPKTIEPSGPPPYNNVPNRSPPQKKVKSDPESAIFFAAQPLPFSVPAKPQFMPQTVYPSSYGQPQYPAMTKFANPLTPAQPNLAFLPLFNQTATQRRVSVEYPAEFSGPSHAGKWTAKCVVNGIVKGMGTGGSKQVAKEEAAKQAWYSLGWS